jgi:putative endonuclease
MTSDLISRFRSHNELGKNGWTIKFSPWKVVHVEFFATKKEALVRERYLKSGTGREWVGSQVVFDGSLVGLISAAAGAGSSLRSGGLLK